MSSKGRPNSKNQREKSFIEAKKPKASLKRLREEKEPEPLSREERMQRKLNK